jgi:endonuclease/exonuclease/phosphatase family metal-dependent hydrolase
MTPAVEVPQSNLESLNHNLEPYFAELAQFNSTAELEKSEIYRRLKPEIDTVLNTVVQENFSPWQSVDKPNADFVQAVAWNIERGIQIHGIIDVLQNHPELREKDLYLLTELDYGMARAHNLNIAREIAQALKLNYAFATCYINLEKGSGVEAFVDGENTKALHGLALMSRYPIRNVYAVPLPNGRDKMFGKEKRLGSLKAIVADVEHPLGMIRAVVVHLDAHSSRNHRVLQMKTVLDFVEKLPELPVVLAGDWNTTTHNSQNATRAIMGYWRRVLMGPKNVAFNHYPHPERFFEKSLFQQLERYGYQWRELNEIGVGTLHYDMNSFEKNTNLGDWVPDWCFPWIRWAMEKVGGKCSLKLDWFTGKSIQPVPNSKPKVIGNLKDGNAPLSDHDAIVLDFVLK